MYRLVAFTAVLVGMFGLVAAAYIQRTAAAATFFSRQLAASGAQDRVSLEGTPYTVKDGAVEQAPASPLFFFRNEAVLRGAYALELAKRSPILGMAGVQPQSLSAAVKALATSTDALAQVQATSSDAALVREGLYPLTFLNALATLEAARLQYIESGSDTDERSYLRALHTAISAGMLDAAEFQGILDEEIGMQPLRIPTLGGTLTGATLENSVAIARTRFAELATEMQKRTSCLSGYISDCPSSALTMVVPAEDDSVVSVPQKEAGIPDWQEEFVLSTSTCLTLVPGPYLMGYGTSTEPMQVPVQYLEERYFAPIENSTGAAAMYLHQKLGIEYSVVDPMVFYECPDVESDIGTIEAISATVRFAEAHRAYAPTEAAKFLDSPLYSQHDAIAYIDAVAAYLHGATGAVPPSARNDFDELLNRWSERTGGLAVLVSEIARVNARDVALREIGVPLDLSARTLFLTHSAFPSLFLTESSAAGSTTVALRSTDSGDLAALARNYLPYSQLVDSIGATRLGQEISAFRTFEGLTGN